MSEDLRGRGWRGRFLRATYPRGRTLVVIRTEGAVRAFEQSRLTGVRRVRTVAVAGVGSVHRRLSIVVHERHLECRVTWVNLE